MKLTLSLSFAVCERQPIIHDLNIYSFDCGTVNANRRGCINITYGENIALSSTRKNVYHAFFVSSKMTISGGLSNQDLT